MTQLNIPPNMISPKWIMRLALLILAVIFIRSTFIFVPPGYAGVVYDLGRGVLPGVMDEGMNFAIPIWQNVKLFDTRLQEYTMSSIRDEGAVMGDDSLDAPTSDGQQVKVDATVLFMIDKDTAPELWKTVGDDYINKLVRPVSRSQIRMVISRYTAPVIYSEKRQEAEATMTREIAAILKPKHIIVDKVLLRSVNFSPEYSKAIEDKVIAEQKVKQAQYEVQEATQRAEAKIAEAKGLAEAQSLQRSTLTQEFIQMEAIKKWNGVLPQVVGSGNAPFINIPLR